MFESMLAPFNSAMWVASRAPVSLQRWVSVFRGSDVREPGGDTVGDMNLHDQIHENFENDGGVFYTGSCRVSSIKSRQPDILGVQLSNSGWVAIRGFPIYSK